MSAIQRLREDREVARNTMLQLRDRITAENRDFNDTERAAWEKANKDWDALGEQVRALERCEELDYDNDDRQVPGLEDYAPKRARRMLDRDAKGEGRQQSVADLALAGWMLGHLGHPTNERHQRAARKMGISPRQAYIDIPLAGLQTRAQSVGTDAAGGYSVPTTLANTVEFALKQWNCIRRVADVFQTPTGEDYDVVTCNDVANVGTLLAENTTVGAAVDMTFAKTTYAAYKFQSGLVLASAELMQDNAVGLNEEIGRALGERIGRGQEAYFTTGTGSSQPQGIVTASSVGKTTASATAITGDELFDLYHSVDPAYRADPSFAWMMHDNIALYIRKLKDGASRYLWEFDLEGGQRELLLGKPVHINMSMASAVTTGLKTVLVGAFKKFKVRDAGMLRLLTLRERYADIDQVGFVGFLRSDSRILAPTSAVPIKHLLQA